MNIRDQVLAILNSPSKETFLLVMGHRLGIAARDVFAGDMQRGMRQAQACNEMMIAIFSQVRAMKDDGADGYPDSDFLSVLLGKADAGDARPHLRHAIESALLSVGAERTPEP
ncbi:hypothetical protein [Streptomyces caniscabiei]|uniref:Uncharacterized protein n=1 Tax=Streptomyces caniscabiei TaxID=2746961 RepID=A0A927L3S9_9ACTN|nr:hypothetical protein [Streptomyces caniscabiei]MBD9700793.1 hypothetical protein [Streptomyces caniscabiei]MBD9725050.1 hypothetical protein [Streptomyces caniscabiei]MDX3510378.1 hypothetical protein [Streptomyces caniscabiei]MDX3720461.1 hypothetical protein [Streptomyces caniscabiei]MDX3727661.1 hypothetical protein [Streptomyces caniscabiei]